MMYAVKWEMQLIEAESPQEAAEKALSMIRDDYTICHVFTTRDEKNVCHTVDLDEIDEDQVLPLTLEEFNNELISVS